MHKGHHVKTRRPLALLAAMVLCSCAGMVGVVSAQSATETGNGRTLRDTGSPPPSAEERRDAVVIHRADGRQVPTGLTEAELRRLQDLRDTTPDEPEYFVTSIDLTGNVTDSQAYLVCTMRIRLTQEQHWVKVPLKLNEAVLRQRPEYVGAGQAAAGTGLRNDPETGYLWWLKGGGEHELRIPVVVPIRDAAPTHRLVLSLPPTAVSRLALQVPMPAEQLKVTPPALSSLSIERSGGNRSEIVVQGLGATLDLTWQVLPRARQTQTVLEAVTHLEVDLTSELLVLVAEQTIAATKGSFSEVTVRMPAGYGLPNVEGESYDSHTADPADPRRITVKLAETTTGPVRLLWTLEAETPGVADLPAVEGFEVEQAYRQTGDIEVLAPEGFHVARRGGRNIYRRNVNPATDADRIATAFLFRKQPFRLELEVNKIEPYFEAEPSYVLNFQSDVVELHAVFHLEVFRDRGAVREIELHWPQKDAQNWELDQSSLMALADRVETDPMTGGVRLHLASFQTGTFDLPLRARRPFQPGGDSITISLPSINAPSVRAASLVTCLADNLEATIRRSDGGSLRGIGGAALKAEADIPENWRHLRSEAWQLEAAAQQIRAQASVHDPQIEGRTVVSLVPQSDRWEISQKVNYNVEYQRLSELQFLVAPGVVENLQFIDGDGTPLKFETVGADSGDDPLVEIRVPLGTPRLGMLEVTALYSQPMTPPMLPGETSTLRFPLIQSQDVSYSNLQVTIPPGGPLRMQLPSADWTRVSLGEYAWSAKTPPPTELAVSVEYADSPSAAGYTISRGLLHSTVDTNGTMSTTARYRIAGQVPHVLMVMPPGLVVDRIQFDEHVLLVDADPPKDSAGFAEYRLEWPRPEQMEGLGTEHLLTLEFHTRTQSPSRWWHRLELDAPRFSPNVWINQLIWNVELPETRHLFLPPGGYASDFHWLRRGAFWFREPKRTAAELSQWISDDVDPLQSNVYQFSRFGPGTQMRLASMSRPALVLIGAGTALAAGFLLLQIPLIRTPLAALGLGFVLAVCGIWFSAPLQVLAQPAVLGLILAIAAAVIDGYLRRRRGGVVRLSPPSDFDFAVPASSESAVSHVSLPAVGSDEPTAIRAASSFDSEPVSASSNSGTSR